jgi:uncharacterized membrane protein
VATLALALLAVIAALVPLATWARVILLVPLVFALPGYAVLSALLPAWPIPAAERAVYAVALSIAVCVLAGVSTQLVLGLDRAMWAAVLTLVTVAASTVALQRQRPLAWRRPPLPAVTMPAPTTVLAFVVAAGLAAWAISLASASARESRADARFTEIWALPVKPPAPGGAAVSIGVANHEDSASSYVVDVTQKGAALLHEPIALRDGERWQVRLPVAAITGARPVEVTLQHEGHVYRRAYLNSGRAS